MNSNCYVNIDKNYFFFKQLKKYLNYYLKYKMSNDKTSVEDFWLSAIYQAIYNVTNGPICRKFSHFVHWVLYL